MRKTLCIILIVIGLLSLYAAALLFSNLVATGYVALLALMLALFLTRDPFASEEPEERTIRAMSASFNPPPPPEKKMKLTDHAHA
jgi:hypothetical protein